MNEINSQPNVPLLTESELANTLGISIWTIRRWRKTQGLPHLGIARRFFYRLPSVYKWMSQQEVLCTNK